MSNFTFLGCLEVVDLWLETKAKQHFHRFNGFLSLQLKLRLELGFGLRLTNYLQGDVFKVISFGKECFEEDKYLYTYKESVKIPILSMVDDALLVSECGYKISMLNAFINTKTSMKKLQFGTAKCFKMHVGKQMHRRSVS